MAGPFDNTIFADNIYLQQGIVSLVAAFEALFQGSISGFLANLIGLLPLIGTFFIIYKLFEFVGVISVFKNPEHKGYARWIGLGVAFIGIVTPAVANLIVGLFANSLLILLILIFGIWGLIFYINHMRKAHIEQSIGLNSASAQNLERKRDRRAQAQENKMQRKLHRLENEAIDRVEDKMAITMQLQKNSLATIKNMISVLGRLVSITDTKQKEKLQSHLSKNLIKFTRQIDDEYLDLEKARRYLERLRQLDIQGITLVKKDEEVIKRVEQYLQQILTNRVGKTAGEQQEIKLVDEDLKQFNNEINILGAQLAQLHTDKLRLIGSTETYIMRIEKEYKSKIYELKQKLTTSLTQGDISDAINVLHELQHELTNIENADKSLLAKIKDIESFENLWKNTDKELNRLVRKLTGKPLENAAKNENNSKVESTLSKGFKWARSKIPKFKSGRNQANTDIVDETGESNNIKNDKPPGPTPQNQF